ncbi:MAG: hypothetical protein M0C28_01020 [Candidatus Moduliflexus flocculans]|nr:hypothetical protein [Candidatus Moduliflexus flocculans]
MLNLALMWNVMAGEGIWFPDRGVHVLADLLRERFARSPAASSGSGPPVRRIVVRGRPRRGRRHGRGRCHRGGTGSSPTPITRRPSSSSSIRPTSGGRRPRPRSAAVPYTELRALRLSRPPARSGRPLGDAGGPPLLPARDRGAAARRARGFRPAGRSRSASGPARPRPSCPAGRDALVLRAGFPYEHFASWRLAEKKRREGYAELQEATGLEARPDGGARPARSLRRRRGHGSRDAADLQGLGRAVRGLDRRLELGSRHVGRAARPGPRPDARPRAPRRGAYATTELVLGGVPTALLTGQPGRRPGPIFVRRSKIVRDRGHVPRVHVPERTRSRAAYFAAFCTGARSSTIHMPRPFVAMTRALSRGWMARSQT